MSSPDRFSDFGRDMARELGELRDGSGVAARVRIRLRNRREAAARPWRMWAVAAVPAVALALGVLLWFPRSEPLRAFRGTDHFTPLEVGSWVHADENQSPVLRFSDDAEVFLEPRAAVKIVGIDGRAARLALDHGRARVSVVPNRGADYRISAGPFEVQVKGTRFRLGWDPAGDRFELALYEGHVVLSGCAFGPAFGVAAGQEVSASCHDGKLDVKPIAAPSSVPAASASPAATPPTPLDVVQPESNARPDVPAANAVSSSWVGLARHGHRHQAWTEIKSQGVENVVRNASPADLILLGDTARDVGELALARRTYQLVRSRAPGSHFAAFAAFALGRLDFDDRGAHRESADWFGAYLKEEPRGELAREARGRLMEALHRSGSDAAARQVADDYLRLHPRGPHAKLAAQLARPEEPHR